MWKLFAKRRFERLETRDAPIRREELERAGRILFAVFARYGDSVIAFKSIDRFIAAYSGKEYTVITTPQALPYARELIRAPVRLYAVNKRRHPIRLLRLVLALRRRAPDVGFNPWSHGLESNWLVSYCTRFYLFRSYDASHHGLNHYEKLRGYMLLPPPLPRRPWDLPRAAERILLAPFSTDVERSLGREEIETLIRDLRARYPRALLTLALMTSERGAIDAKIADRLFIFRKTRPCSERFIALVKRTELFVGVDSGPLHVADAIGVPAVAFFGPTTPVKVLDRDSRAISVDKARRAATGWLSGATMATPSTADESN